MKECKVLINNDAVTVFDYDGVHVQVPSIKRIAKTVKVVKSGNAYTVVSDDYEEPKPEKVMAEKKTTVKDKQKYGKDLQKK